MRLLVGDLTVVDADPAPLRYRVVQQITRHSDNFHLCMSDQTLNFTPFLAEPCSPKMVIPAMW